MTPHPAGPRGPAVSRRRDLGRRPGGAVVLTALVVDDSAGARTRVSTVLRMGGWEVHEPVGTQAAVDLAVAVRPDLVVTDFVLRGGNGAALLHRLRDEGCRARSVVVASRVTDEVRGHAAAVGAMACLAKPVDPRELLHVMRALGGDPVDAVPLRARAAPVRVEAQRLDRPQDRHGSPAPRRVPAVGDDVRPDDPEEGAPDVRRRAGAGVTADASEVAGVRSPLVPGADRGVRARTQLMQLVAISVSAPGRRRPPGADRAHQG